MSYPINQVLTYTAVAATSGAPSDTFTYAWAFDDSTSGTGNTLAHAWSVAGNHLATVTATDTATLGSASAVKAISVSDWSTLTWVSTGQKIIPTASAAFALQLGTYTYRLLSVGNLLVNMYDFNNPTKMVTFDTVTLTRNEYSPAYGAIGSPDGCYLLDTGPNAGKILVVGKLTGRYGFINPSNGTIVVSPTAMPFTIEGATAYRTPMCKMGNGKILLPGYLNGPYFRFMSYDPIADSWSSAISSAGAVIQMTDLLPLPSGKVIGWVDGLVSRPSYIYNWATNSWAAGPTLPISTAYPYAEMIVLADGKIANVDATSVLRTWTEGDAAFASRSAVYPYTSQNAGSAGNSVQQLVLTPEGAIVNIGGYVASGAILDTKTVFYVGGGVDAWIVGTPLLTTGISFRGAFNNGKIWRAAAGGVLEYMVW